MLLKIYPENPNPKSIEKVVHVLKKGGVIIYPTDTMYGIGCDISNKSAIERVCNIKGINPSKANLSFICNDLSHLSSYTKVVDTPTFRVLKSALPGPFTFILNANNNVPKLLCSNRKTVGIRIPNNDIALAIVKDLGTPILSTSIITEGVPVENITDPELIYEDYKNKVDLVIDGGVGSIGLSTVIDCTQEDTFVLVRQGLGLINNLAK